MTILVTWKRTTFEPAGAFATTVSTTGGVGVMTGSAAGLEASETGTTAWIGVGFFCMEIAMPSTAIATRTVGITIFGLIFVMVDGLVNEQGQ